MSHLHPAQDTEALLYGRQLAAEGFMEDAAAAFEMALEARPDNVSAAYHLGCALMALGRHGAAAEVMETWATRSPLQTQVAACVAVALEHHGRREASLAWMDRALEHEPLGPWALAPMILALDYLEEPRARFMELLAMNPGDCGPLLRAAESLADVGDITGAREALEDLLMLSPGNLHASEALESLFEEVALAS